MSISKENRTEDNILLFLKALTIDDLNILFLMNLGSRKMSDTFMAIINKQK
jgi:hypothetical protein